MNTTGSAPAISAGTRPGPGRDGVLVTGALGPAGRSLVEQLAGRGRDVVGVDLRGGATGVLAAPPVGDPGYLPRLAELVAARAVGLVVPTVSEELLLVARPAVVAMLGAPVAVAPEEAVAVADDKLRTCQALRAAGVEVPAYLPGDADPGPLQDRRFLSKPRVGRGGREVVVHLPGTTPRPDATRVLQEFVPGAEYAVNVHLGAGVAVVLEKRTLAHGEVGNATAVRRDDLDSLDVAALALAAVHALGVLGAADVDVRRRADGTPVVLEVNARFGAHSAHAPELLDAVLAEHDGRRT